MPSIVIPRGASAVTATDGQFELEMVPRNCRRKDYKKKKVPPVVVDEEIIAYASPDSTYAVTKRLLDSATDTILIGIYDFSAEYMKQIVLNAMRRGVKVELMLDVDSKAELAVFEELERLGAECVEAPSCASKRVHYFASSHEKVIVIDKLWTLVQSGNYSSHSIPLNEVDGGGTGAKFVTGNRDTGLAIKSKRLAKYFTEVLRADMKLETEAAEAEAAPHLEEDEFLVEAAPKKIPDRLYKSKTFPLNVGLSLQPVLSPDNYMDVVPDMIRKAKKSVLIEQQYIHASQEKITDLLSALKEAMDSAKEAGRKFDVRIILGKLFNKADLPKEMANLKVLKDTYGLILGKHVRYIDTTRFVHCHNKMVLVDGAGVLVSSQNWSTSAVWLNREAGVMLEHKGICRYFTDIFETDWKTALKEPSLGANSPEIAEATVAKGGFTRVVAADYQDV